MGAKQARPKDVHRCFALIPHQVFVNEALAGVRVAAEREGFAERELHVVDRGFKWGELESHADNFSLFASRRLLELRLSSPRIGDAGSKAARELIENIADDQCLLIGIHARLDASTARLAWVKAVERHGVRVEVWPVEPSELPRWVGERARRHGGIDLIETPNLVREVSPLRDFRAYRDLRKLIREISHHLIM